jgi:hypothetical protein
MRSASIRASIRMSAALLVLVLLGSNVLAQSVSVVVNQQFGTNPVPVGVESDASVSAMATPPTPPSNCTLTGPSWSWSVNGPAGVVVNGNGSSATVAANVSTSGTYSVTVTATATWMDSCGTQYEASNSVTLNDLIMVSVVSITPLPEVYSTKTIGDTLTQDDFSITTNPAGYANLVTVNPVTIQIGDNIVTATCGSSSATTDVIGCQFSGSLSGLIVGGTGNDDSVNFTAEVQGCDGSYTITGNDSDSVIDGGDTSGTLYSGDQHSGTVYISSSPPSGPNVSQLPLFMHGKLAYGLGGMPGGSDIKRRVRSFQPAQLLLAP